MRKTVLQKCSVISNRKLDKEGHYYRLAVLGFRTVRKIHSGQFVHIKINEGNDPFFRRAFSIADFDNESGRLEIIYKVVGRGTSILSKMKKGDWLDFVGPLGNKFSRPGKKKQIVIVAGGVGLPPLLYLAKYLIEDGCNNKNIHFFYGGQKKSDLIEMPAIRKLGVKFFPCTDDGSYGFHGFVTEALANKIDSLNPGQTMIYGCGPELMLAAMQELALDNGFSGELSLEAPMPCGVGVCLGCVKPRYNNPARHVRVCYDGPVFKIGEVSI